MKRRKTVSVTPAIGASTVAGDTNTGPMRTEAGTRVSGGIWCSVGLSQSFFTVKPLPAINLARNAVRTNVGLRLGGGPRCQQSTASLLGGSSLAGLGVLAAEALHTARCIHQSLLTGEEWVASGADF